MPAALLFLRAAIPFLYSSSLNADINDGVSSTVGSAGHLGLGVSMSSNCTFDFHLSNLYKRCSNLGGRILRTFTTRDP